jgi:hypothetical protein
LNKRLSAVPGKFANGALTTRFPRVELPEIGIGVLGIWRMYSKIKLTVFLHGIGLLMLSGPASLVWAEVVELNDDQRFTRMTAPLEEHSGRHPDFSERAEVIIKRFRELWADDEYGDQLHDLSDDTLVLRLRAAETALFSGQEPWMLERFDSALEVALARDLATPAQLRWLYDAYQAAWDYDAARLFREKHPDAGLPELPEIVPLPEHEDERSRVVWHVHDDPPRLKAEAINLDDIRMLVVTSPGCGFSHQAAQALGHDEVLGPLVRAHALWITGRTNSRAFHRLIEWNQRYPGFETVVVDDQEQWPVSSFYRYPRFFFVTGEQVEESSGWRGGAEGLQAIADQLISLGLLDPASVAEDAFAYADEPSAPGACAERAPALAQANELALIRTRDELDAHLLKLEAGLDSPMGKLSEEARRRLVYSISWTSRGVAGFRHDDLAAQLEPEDFYQVVSLFGKQYFYAGQHYPIELLSDEERDLRDRVHCAGKYANKTE